jgi:hypothetical protein
MTIPRTDEMVPDFVIVLSLTVFAIIMTAMFFVAAGMS